MSGLPRVRLLRHSPHDRVRVRLRDERALRSESSPRPEPLELRPPKADSTALVRCLPQSVESKRENLDERELTDDATCRAGCVWHHCLHVRWSKHSSAKLERLFAVEDGLSEPRVNRQNNPRGRAPPGATLKLCG